MPSIVETLRSIADYLEQHRGDLAEAIGLLKECRESTLNGCPRGEDAALYPNAFVDRISLFLVKHEPSIQAADPVHVPLEPPAPQPPAIGKPSVGRPRV